MKVQSSAMYQPVSVNHARAQSEEDFSEHPVRPWEPFPRQGVELKRRDGAPTARREDVRRAHGEMFAILGDQS